ncbi:DUF1302 domain-containing protein [Ramlibacter sp. WS9]|uniref:DUF1302 domain-containing protein n=1 Tax=Ramlibacter sp. WS9 TaxID=1882741 RepID=UPI00114166E8|nr:DUF1302 family protein [Ramlibacter sp. WS9]ROZ75053.1 DUF1302 family protein [Ramlibacter sp. WS9]
MKTKTHPTPRTWTLRPAALAVLALCAGPALAIEIDTGNEDVSMRWDNTLKYSAAARLKRPQASLLANPNNDDGDRNFSKGVISNRVDVLSEFDVSWQKRLGLRVSAAGWYDSVYNKANDNPGFPGGAAPNQLSVPYNQFTAATREVHGRDAEVLDAFVFGKFEIGSMNATVRAGRHALVWGESLFFGGNAIAGGQMPVDAVKLVSVPGTQFKEAIRPVPQLSGQVQLNSQISVGGYVQTSWAPNRTPAVGSYFSNADPAIDGGEAILLGPGLAALRQPDLRPSNSGQGGLQLRIRGEQTDYGLYAIRFHNKAPQLVSLIGMSPMGPIPIGYQLAYHQKIEAYGASASRTFGNFNVAVEGSLRRNQDLASSQGADVSSFTPAPRTNNTDNPGYAVGNTAHINLSTLASLEPTPMWREASLVAEVAWNRVLKVTRNAAAIDPNGTRDGVALRAVLEPKYRNVFDGVDIGVPIGLGWAPKGSRPLAMTSPNMWVPAGGGDVSVGLNGSFRDVWRFSLAYTHYFGPSGTFNDASAGNAYSWKHTLRDRDFVAASLSYSF